MKFWSATVVLFLALFAFAEPSPAQGLTDADRKAYAEFLEAGELNDLKAMERIAQRFRKELEAVIADFESQLAYDDTVELWDQYRKLARALDQAAVNNYHSVQMKLTEKLTLEQRQKRYELRNQYDGIRGDMQQALNEKSAEQVQAVVPQLTDLADAFAANGDPVYQSYCLALAADGLKAIEQQVEAVKLYDRIDQALTAAGFENFRFQGEVRSARESLVNQGFDPNAKPGEMPQGPAGNTGTSWSKDPAGQSWSDPAPLKLVADEKVCELKTPNPANSIDTLQWQLFYIGGNKPIPFEERFKPMGKGFSVRRDGVKVFIKGEDDAKEREIKVISKPNLVEMERTYTDMEGKEQKQQYAWLAACGSEDEQLFGIDVNLAPQVDGNFGLRYSSGCYLKGKVLGQDLLIYDDNVTGRFGDPIEVRDNVTNTVGASFTYNDAMRFGKQKVVGPWTEYLELDGAFYRVKLDPDSYAVRTRKLDVDTGTIKLSFKGKQKPALVVVEETREFKGAFFVLNEKTPTIVPVGTYRLSYGLMRTGSGKNEITCQMFPGDSVALQVRKGEEVVFELGAPFTFDFQAEKSPAGLKIIGKSVLVKGKAGEYYMRFYDDPPIPDKVTVKGGGKPLDMKKATIDDFRKEQTCVWGPLDLMIPGKDNEYEVRMELKKHDLLGGPIESEWKKF